MPFYQRPSRSRFSADREPRKTMCFYNQVAMAVQLDCKNTVLGGVRKSALRRVLCFSIKLHCQCNLNVKNNGFARLPGDFETASARALVKWLILAKNAIFLLLFLTFSGAWFWTPRVDCKVNCKIDYKRRKRMTVRSDLRRSFKSIVRSITVDVSEGFSCNV